MYNRIKYIIVALHNNKIAFAHNNLNAFVKGMKDLEPNMLSRSTVEKRLTEDGVVMFVGKFGDVYHFYRYENPKYKKQPKYIKK